MKIRLSEKSLKIGFAKVIGVIDIAPDDRRSEGDFIEIAKKMQSSGAEFVEIGIAYAEKEGANQDTEERLLLPVVRAVADSTSLFIGANTSFPDIMEKAVTLGASFIIDELALRREGAIETVAKLQVPVCLCYDPFFGEYENETDGDEVSNVSEFFFERIDSCLNGGIRRNMLMLDVTLNSRVSLDVRLKVFGRIESFKSFALPIILQLPRCYPPKDALLEESAAIPITLTLFCATHGVAFIRTKKVEDATIALATWHLANQKARPFQLSKGVIRRLRNLRDRIHIKIHKKKEI